MTWFHLIIGLVSLGREIIKYLREQNECKKTTAKTLTDLKMALKKSRQKGDTSDLEKMFSDLRLPGK